MKPRPILFVEGPTDKIILENAWDKLKNGIKRRPFKIQQAFDRFFIGNTFRRCEIFKNNDNNLFFGMLDFDEAFEDWNRLLELKDVEDEKKWVLLEKDHKRGLLIKHKKHKAFVFYYQLPEHRITYASEQYGKTSQLSIELLFTDDKLSGFIEEKEIPGGVKIIKIKDNKKMDFANNTNNFKETDFYSFKTIFEIIEKIIAEANNE